MNLDLYFDEWDELAWINEELTKRLRKRGIKIKASMLVGFEAS